MQDDKRDDEDGDNDYEDIDYDDDYSLKTHFDVIVNNQLQPVGTKLANNNNC